MARPRKYRPSSLYSIGQVDQIGLEPRECENIRSNGGREAARAHVQARQVHAGTMLCIRDEQGSMYWYTCDRGSRLVFHGSRR